jgi:hypothetical protein
MRERSGSVRRASADCQSAIGSFVPTQSALAGFAIARSCNPFRTFPKCSSQQDAILRYLTGASSQTVETIGEGIQVMKKELFEELKRSLGEARQIRNKTIKPSRVFKTDPKNDFVKVSNSDATFRIIR